MSAGDVALELLFRCPHLTNAPRVWRVLAQQAEKEQWSYRDFLAFLITQEIAHRQQTRVQRPAGS